MRARRHPRGRGAYTLVELLVAISLILLLAGLMVAFYPRASTQARESRGAQQLQGWLNIARGRAQRDQAPRGLRIWWTQKDDVTNLNVGPLQVQATKCQYLEQPDDYMPGPLYSNLDPDKTKNPQPERTLLIDGGALFNGNVGNRVYWDVQPGDYLEIGGTGLMHRVLYDQENFQTPNYPALTYDNVGNKTQVLISTPVPVLIPTTQKTTNYRFVRTPRVTDEDPLDLPDDLVIDLRTNYDYGNPLPLVPNPFPPYPPAAKPAPPPPPPYPGGTTGYLDIVFAPSGAVITPGVTTTTMNIWVRDVSGDAFGGEPTVVAVFSRTGFVGAFGVDPSNNRTQPYSLIR